MSRRSSLFTLAALMIALALPGAADASHVTCRQILTEDTTLDSDVNCQTVAAPGLQLGAPDITLDMNGYTVRNPPQSNALVGIRSLNGHDGVRVLNGKVEGFALGVDLLSTDRSEVSGMEFDLSFPFSASNPYGAVRLRNSDDATVTDVTTGDGFMAQVSGSERTSLTRAICTNPDFANEIVMAGADLRLEDTRGCRIHVSGDRFRVAGNESEWILSAGAGQEIVGNTTGHIRLERVNDSTIDSNLVTGGSGIDLVTARGNVVRGNRVVDPVAASPGCFQPDVMCGAVLLNSSNANQIVDNELAGRPIGIGLTAGSSDNTVADNAVSGSLQSGVSLYTADRNTFSGNEITGSELNGVEFLFSSDDNVVERNRVAESGADGIFFLATGSTRNRLEANRVSASGDDGIDVDVAGNTLTANSVFANADWGIEAVAGTIDGGANRGWSNGQPAQCLNVVCGPGPAATLSLSPTDATNTVGDEHCVTATVADPDGRATPGVTVRFSVNGDDTIPVPTDAGGTATHCYDGPVAPRNDEITAYADDDGDATQDPGEPGATASKSWVLPQPSDRCTVMGVGTITAANGDPAAFRINARVHKDRSRGSLFYEDEGPADSLVLRSSRLSSITCAGGEASIYGRTHGSAPVSFRIDVTDGPDTYRIRTSGGYDSGERPVASGNIRVW